MNCRDSSEMIESYLVNGIDPMQDRHLAGHINSCPKCRDELAFLLKYRVIMKQVKPVSPPDNFINELHSRIETEKQRDIIWKISTSWSNFRRGIKFPLEAAGALAVAAIILVVYRPFFSDRTADITVSESARSSRSVTVQKKVLQEKSDRQVTDSSTKEIQTGGKGMVSSEDITGIVKDKIADEKRGDSIPAVKSEDSDRGILNEMRKSPSVESEKSVMKKEESVTADSLKSKDSASVKRDNARPSYSAAEKIFSDHKASVIKKDLSREGKGFYRIRVESSRHGSMLGSLKEKFSVEEKIISRDDSFYEVELFLSSN